RSRASSLRALPITVTRTHSSVFLDTLISESSYSRVTSPSSRALWARWCRRLLSRVRPFEPLAKPVSAGMRQILRPISPKRFGNAAFARNGPQKASLCTRRRSCRARSYWPRRRTTRRPPQQALITCAATSNTCSIRPVKEENDHENHRRDQRGGSHRAGLGYLYDAHGH